MKKKSIKRQVFMPITMTVIFQAVIIFVILGVSGEFGNIESYTFDMLNERTSNRANYVEAEMSKQMAATNESAEIMDRTVRRVLSENKCGVSAISESIEINRRIMDELADRVMYILEKNDIDDAFVILDSGGLFSASDGGEARSCIYLRNDSEADEIIMEAGYSQIAERYGMRFSGDRSECLEMIYGEEGNYSFYFDTLKNAELHSELSANELGHWTKFSQISDSDVKSIKYTVPLISSDGTVYGIVGTGITEKSILSHMPINDFFDENTCYVFGVDSNSDDNYNVQLHTGSVYSKLIGEQNRIVTAYNVESGLTVFDQQSKYESIGCISGLSLYSENSPYYSDKWAVISVSEKNELMRMYRTFIKSLLISLLISVLIGICIAMLISRRICRPLSDVADTLSSTPPDEIIQFADTGISEVDKLTNAIEEMQQTVEESASRVSEIIKLVDIGIGVFMIDRATGSVFVSENLVKMLEIKDLPEGDVNMEYYQFTLRLNKKSKEKMLFTGKPDEDFIDNKLKELKISGDDGSTKWFKFNTVNDNRKILGVVQDVTKQIVEKSQLEYERDYDITTGLLNRRAYYKRVAGRFQFRSTLKIAAFIMLDLDNLKYINDTYGHDFGDDYIKSAANVLKEFDNYNGIVSRLSGDEFSVFLSGFNSKNEIRKIIGEVREKLLSSCCLLPDGSRFRIRCSMGVSWYPENSEAYDVLMKYADFAMYTIKKSTKGSLAEFDMEVYSKDSILITGTEEMNRIIEEKSVKYAFHTIVNARNGSIYGYEALMRPQSEIIKTPLDFLRIAKTAVRLNAVETLTWTEALKAFGGQIAAGNIKKGSKIFINSISNCTISEETIEHIETTYDDMLSDVILEILESEETDNEYNERKKKRMAKWKAGIALDDFGTGYNSELALITVNPDIIKIDRSIISGCDKDESRRNILQGLIRFAGTKNTKVLAEGVETYGEMKTVIECGVDFIQGYYISKPLYEPAAVDEKIVNEIKSLAKK